MHALEGLFSFLSLQIQTVSNNIRMHAVEILFKKMHFPIFSNTVRIHALETFFQNTIHVSLIVFILRKTNKMSVQKQFY